jgi:hypothetical protein
MADVEARRCNVCDDCMRATGGGSGGVCACRVPTRNCIELLILHWAVWALVP